MNLIYRIGDSGENRTNNLMSSTSNRSGKCMSKLNCFLPVHWLLCKEFFMSWFINPVSALHSYGELMFDF